MTSLGYTIKSRGILNTFQRVWYLYRYFGLGSRHAKLAIKELINMCNSYGLKPTFPVPGRTMQLHSSFFSEIKYNSELILHGLVHSDYSLLSYERQKADFKEALEIFNNIGINPKGFRGPYLKSNKITQKVISELGLSYDASPSFYHTIIPENNLIKKVLDLYQPEDEYLPHLGEVVKIPVSLPDDEMLIDRLGYKSKEVISVWREMFDIEKKRNGLFVLQLHPQRFFSVKNELNKFLEYIASDQTVWLASLNDISEWFSKKSPEQTWPKSYKCAFCVSGDVDVLSIWDYRKMKDNIN